MYDHNYQTSAHRSTWFDTTQQIQHERNRTHTGWPMRQPDRSQGKINRQMYPLLFEISQLCLHVFSYVT